MKEKFSSILAEVIKTPQAESRRIVEELVVYLKELLSNSEKEKLVDTWEVLQNKGYESIADAERKEIAKAVLENTREMARKMLSRGVSVEDVAQISGMTEEEIRSL